MGDKSVQKRIIKPKTKAITIKRFFGYGFSLILLLITLILLFYFVRGQSQAYKSKQIISKINNISNSELCSTGLKQVKPSAANVSNNSEVYNDAAREKVLNYLLSCTVISSGSNKLTPEALNYAAQLNAVYVKEGNQTKQTQLKNYITYIKSNAQQ